MNRSGTELAEARTLMQRFAKETGISDGASPPRRYLWTDAFAVCNCLTLYRRSDDESWLGLALDLVDQLHHVLGRHRRDDPRQGWLSGLGPAEGEEHPTAGGLRIGKPLPERRRDEPVDPHAEWDRDGQYFHYLTKWMHALCRVGAVTGKYRYWRWAAELAKAAHAGFFFPSPSGGGRLAWKMNVDLSYPVVPSTGLHDPLDAFLTCREIAYRGRFFGAQPDAPDLSAEIADAGEMIRNGRWETDDPLGVGGLLVDFARAIRLAGADALGEPNLPARLNSAASASLALLDARSFAEEEPTEYRLAFRELGLSIGLEAVDALRESISDRPAPGPPGVAERLRELARYLSLGRRIEAYWLRPSSRQTRGWAEHLDINRVMLATSLLPDEFIAL